MKRFLSLLVAVTLGGCFATVDRHGRVVGEQAMFTLTLPAVLPPLVVVQPGVSVASDLDDEVFYADGSYWARQDQTWFRSPDHRSGWVRVDGREVPRVIAQSPPGRYRRYHGEGRGGGEQEHARREGHEREGHEDHDGDRR
jgi:hypothetical protein